MEALGSFVSNFVSNDVRGEIKKRLIGELEKYFCEDRHLRMYKKYLERRMGRTFEWLCTQTDPSTPLPAGLPVSIASLHFLYKQQLDFFHKRFFDPTNRNHGKDTRLCLLMKKHPKSEVIEGTIGCLQFIRWAQRMHLMEYCLKNQKALTKLRHQQRKLKLSMNLNMNLNVTLSDSNGNEELGTTKFIAEAQLIQTK